MKILRMSWQNFKGLTDGKIRCDGYDVTISGRNGVGKSSIASILPFVLFGKIPAKGFDSRGLTVDSQIPTATIEFDTVSLKRQVTARNVNRTFINDLEVPATRFNAEILNLTNGAGTLIFNPFELPNMHWKDQRDFLLRHFTKPTDETDFSETYKDDIKRLKREVAGIPYQISELQNQLSGMPTGDVEALERVLAERQMEFNAIRTENYMQQEAFLTDQLRTLESRRLELLATYRGVKTNCPTCGAPLPKSKVESARAEIVTKGKKVAAQIAELKLKVEDVRRKSESAVEKTLRAKQLQDEIRALSGQIADLRSVDKLENRIKELSAKEKMLNGQIVELENRLMAAQENRRSRLIQSESLVNAQFKFVKFKLFKVLANGELKEDCTAMLDGVPFQALSKGEKLKAALDILRTLQKVFQIEAPLFLDDAESYTSNSFIKIPNQLFLFKVTDADLKISVESARKAA